MKKWRSEMYLDKDDIIKYFETVDDIISNLEEENERLRDALEYYAEKDNDDTSVALSALKG